jgi:hypothetical protein
MKSMVAQKISSPVTPILAEHDFDLDDISYVADLYTSHFKVEDLRTALRRSEYLLNYHGGCVDYNLREVLFERELQYLLRPALELIRSRQPKPDVTGSNKYINLDKLKRTLDIVEVIGRYVNLKKAGRNYKALCPFHSEKEPSFMVCPEKQSWHCYGACNTGGDAIKFVMQYQHLDFKQAISLLGNK